ncbi:hypothetical protein BDV06DRAFT_58053 [Aspergillus oleicola]
MASSSRHITMNCYEILGILPDASIKDIDSAYRRLALKRHPDKADGDDAAVEFQKINTAVETLRDPTLRAAHDNALRQIHQHHIRHPYTMEEVLFSSPDYSGWRPNGMNRRTHHFTRQNRYMFSFGESVHMNPDSAESRDEIARCERDRIDEAEAEAERARMAAQEEKDREENKPVRQRWKFIWNPDTENFKGNEYRELYGEAAYKSPQDSAWWAGARPHGDEHDHVVPEASSPDGKGTGIPGDAVTYSEVETEAACEIESLLDVQSRSGDKTTPEGESTSTTGFNVDIDVNTPAATDSDEADTESEIDPLVILEPGPEYHAEFDISSIIEAWNNAHAPAERHPIIEEDSDDDAEADVDSTTAEKASVCSKTQNQTQTDPNANADQESAESIYYDFSDATPSQPTHNESEVYHDFPSENENIDIENLIPNLTISASGNVSGTDNSAAASASASVSASVQWHDVPQFDEASVYPHLAPFVPYFTAKLADKEGRYSKDDFQGELKGMVLETYCGWLESVRVSIRGATGSEAECSSLNECRHLGYWSKELGQKSCERCGLWKPIYTLICPGCGIGACVRCKFEMDEKGR